MTGEMTRQLLALLALLTGLAAASVPVNAQEAEALSCEIGAWSESASETSANHAALQKPSKRPAQFAAERPEIDHSVAVKPAQSPVLIGIDRAHI